MENRKAIFHPLFLICLFSLLLNDFYLKDYYGNSLTGKLSDFTGLIVFPVFISYLIPNLKKWISLITAILFLIWKSPLSEPVIESFNSIMPFSINRVIDYTDYWALTVLPVAHMIIMNKKHKIITSSSIYKPATILISLISIFAISATTLQPPLELPGGTIYIGKDYTIKKSKEETIALIKSLGYEVEYYENPDTIRNNSLKTISPSYYQTNNIIIYDDRNQPADTILNIKYSMYEPKSNQTTISLINLTLTEHGNIQRWQTLKKFRKKYKKLLEENFISTLKKADFRKERVEIIRN